jgi:hypothetical protein
MADIITLGYIPKDNQEFWTLRDEARDEVEVDELSGQVFGYSEVTGAGHPTVSLRSGPGPNTNNSTFNREYSCTCAFGQSTFLPRLHPLR